MEARMMEEEDVRATLADDDHDDERLLTRATGGVAPIRPQKDGMFRLGPDKRFTNMERGVSFRRKKPTSNPPSRVEYDQLAGSFDSAEDLPMSRRDRKAGLSSLPEEESSSWMEMRSDGSIETSDGPHPADHETSNPNFDSEPPDTPQLSGVDNSEYDDDDGENGSVDDTNIDSYSGNSSEDDEGRKPICHLQKKDGNSWTSYEPVPRVALARKLAGNPSSSSGTDEDANLRETHIVDDNAGFDQEDIVEDQIQPGGNEKRKVFHLPMLRKPKKKGSDDFTLRTPTKLSQFVDVGAEPMNDDFAIPDQHAKTQTNVRQRGFGRKKNKAGTNLMEGSSPVATNGYQEGKKGLNLRFRKNSNPEEPPGRPKAMIHHGDDYVLRVSDSIPRKEKVAQKIKRRLQKGRKQKEYASGENEESWDWDSDSDELMDGFEADRRSFGDDSAALGYDGSDLHAGDFFNDVESCGVILPPVKDGIAVRARRAKDRKELRVKPLHRFAPHRVFMTEDEIYQNMLRPSELVDHVESFVEPWYNIKTPDLSEMEQAYWGTPDDGRIGSLRVEVLSCVGLAKHKADVSVYLICGDAAFSTDIIHGSRSPMWPSSSKRAACFPLFHAYARMYVGIFDVTSKRTSENDLFCGRVTIDISALRPDSEYDVTLPLRASSFIYDRQPRGVVRLRFSLHWFSERAAVLSYLRAPRNMASTATFMKQPSIPCADPKTFRNVAVTIHGQELPGKYSRPAFRATMREFALYQLNIRHLAKAMLRDAILYQKPLLSFYIFFGWMHCAWYSSVRLLPVYVIGYLIFLLLDGYLHHGTNVPRNMGYSPVSLQEMLLALLSNSKSSQMNPLFAEKIAKSAAVRENEENVEPFDHGEFPFSDRNEYKKRQIEEALVVRSTNARKEKREELQFQERMSIYVRPQNSMDTDSIGGLASVLPLDGDESIMTSLINENETVENEDDSDSGNELDVRGDEDNVFGLNSDEDEEGNTMSSFLLRSSSSVLRSSVVVGPPQDTNVKPKKNIPPQVHLARFEEKLNIITASLSMDKVFSTTLAYRHRPGSQQDNTLRSIRVGGANPPDVKGARRKRKRIPLDDFDKRLGYRVRHPNPVTEITASFLGPLMRIFRILCVVVRVIFNVSVWSDPYLSFWVLCFLILFMLVLIVFPWRLFFFVVGAVGFGPQNILVRMRLEKQAEAKEDLAEVEADATSNSESVPDEGKKGNRRRRQNPLTKMREKLQKKLAEKQDLYQKGPTLSSNLAELEHHSPGLSLDNREAFAASTKTTKKQVQPREIVVPYSRFRKERFFDWPPDPTVARATPIRFNDCQFDMSFSAMASENDTEEYANLRQSTMR